MRYVGQQNEKPWVYTLGFGGGTNCWWAQTPRLAPNDFKTKTVYGVGQDWPIGYDDLEPYYLKAEQIMHLAGSDDIALRYPRSGGYPPPPHALSSVDKAMKAAMPDFHFAAPTARLRVPVGARGACCDSANAIFCPTEAKFTALNTFGDLIASPNVDVLAGARVMAVETAARVATGVRYQKAGKEHVALADLDRLQRHSYALHSDGLWPQAPGARQISSRKIVMSLRGHAARPEKFRWRRPDHRMQLILDRWRPPEGGWGRARLFRQSL
jgi:choline dehydrogenase-like flavoprotein